MELVSDNMQLLGAHVNRIPTPESEPEGVIYGATIGSGRFGRVVECTIPDVDGARRSYAAKLQDDAVDVERYAMKLLEHPLVVRFHDPHFVRTGHLIMDYHPFGDLLHVKELLNREFTTHELWFLFDQCLEALTYIHSKMIIHNDVKPANILLDFEGRIKVADFGSSYVYCRIGKPQTYRGDGTMCSHLPPEAMFGSLFWHVLDWFSLASMIFILAYGEYPYPRCPEVATNNIEMVFAKPPSFHPPLESPHLESLLSKMLILNPSDRLGAGVKDGLEIFLDGDFAFRYRRDNNYSVKKVRHHICRMQFPGLSELIDRASSQVLV